MHKETFKQKVLKSIGNLPQDASLEDVILKIYIVHNDEKEIGQEKHITLNGYQLNVDDDLLKRIEVN